MAQEVARGASMRSPVGKRPLGYKRLSQGDVLPDIAEVSEVRVRHARTSLRSRSGLPPLPGSSAFAWASVRECPLRPGRTGGDDLQAEAAADVVTGYLSGRPVVTTRRVGAETIVQGADLVVVLPG